MPSCVIRKCTNYRTKRNKIHGITYHKFPSDELMRQKWIVAVRQQRSEYDWMPTEHSTICSEHFDSIHKYTSAKGRTLLKKTAVPFFKIDENLPLRQSDSPNSLDDVDISDCASIFETPINTALKKRVRRLVFEKKNLQKINKVLKQQNNRLKKRVETMKSLIEKLKNKSYPTSEQQYKELEIKSEVIDVSEQQNKELKIKSEVIDVSEQQYIVEMEIKPEFIDVIKIEK